VWHRLQVAVRPCSPAVQPLLPLQAALSRLHMLQPQPAGPLCSAGMQAAQNQPLPVCLMHMLQQHPLPRRHHGGRGRARPWCSSQCAHHGTGWVSDCGWQCECGIVAHGASRGHPPLRPPQQLRLFQLWQVPRCSIREATPATAASGVRLAAHPAQAAAGAARAQAEAPRAQELALLVPAAGG